MHTDYTPYLPCEMEDLNARIWINLHINIIGHETTRNISGESP